MKKSTAICALSATILAVLSCGQAERKAETPVYLDESRPLEERVEDALSRMTLEEKVKILHAQSKFSSAGVPRLGIPDLWTTDGPHGIRPEVLWDKWRQAGWTNDSCVAFPALTCLAATWSEEMSALYGKSIGEEARYREKDVLLGPGVNIYRTPLNGRNFEYMGEDPYLASRMVVPYIQEVQKNGVAVCVKHFALNNQESLRHQYDAIIDDRTLNEIYLPAFKAAVQEGGAWSIMGAYNLYKGQHLCHNQYILNDILKKDWGFDGVVISDWGGCHDTDQAITNGLDLEFGTWTDGLTMGATNGYDAYYLADPYLERLRDGRASEEVLNEKARRVLRLNFRTAMRKDKPNGSLCSPEHYDAARRIADEGIVLLKNNDNVLPISRKAGSRILVVGENAVKMMTVGGGSSSLKVQREVLPLDGIRAAAGEGVTVEFERGYVGDISGSYNGVVTGQDLSESRSAEELIEDACLKAKDADAVIFIGGLNKSSHQDCEDSDRFGLGLPYGQDAVIEALAKVNPRLAVVIVSGNAVAMPWVDNVNAIVEAWYCGSQSGTALADIIFGDVNPSGKLPVTFPVRLEDNGAHALGAYDPASTEAHYSEGIFVGYRWAQKKDIKPLFAFGHGLSYTTFSYSEAEISRTTMSENGKVTVSVNVTNTGDREGKEIVQLYIGDDECSVERPVMELKAFRKVSIKPGETVRVSFPVNADMLKFYGTDGWTLEKGSFTAYVGAASDDIRTSVKFNVN
ncbi:MAG: glycoside hydrolase family 3 C-terminal domain-containing protein [Bacteroidales bacterium]|nr:glycoside hydrolase family 3 C-terminal domain-containing protein [Bacteroidales bacterium]MDY2859466.1 glycoside hydrolase family 3 C-terminal domain-containing protein [Candidatus Cryptobacteroides sp.]MDY5442586.1 glycoside hydrolase family 3 C-terminal domain-containing protein [Candidatus Cryptobacteroides sp.]